jgi:hypothetical protein
MLSMYMMYVLFLMKEERRNKMALAGVSTLGKENQ